jgi:hypothetical protein
MVARAIGEDDKDRVKLAQFIALAPELRDALEEALAHQGNEGDCVKTCSGETCGWVVKARAVLARCPK